SFLMAPPLLLDGSGLLLEGPRFLLEDSFLMVLGLLLDGSLGSFWRAHRSYWMALGRAFLRVSNSLWTALVVSSGWFRAPSGRLLGFLLEGSTFLLGGPGTRLRVSNSLWMAPEVPSGGFRDSSRWY